MWNLKPFILLLFLSGYSESRRYGRRSVRSTLTLEEVIPLRGEFYPDKISVKWMSDYEYLVKEGGLGSNVYLKKYDAKTNQYTIIMNASETSQLTNYTFSGFSHDGKYLLLASKISKVYRHSKLAEYFVYDVKNKTIKKVADGPLQVIVWGEGAAVAYVKENNVFYVPDVGDPSTVRQLTTEGVPGLVYVGIADWIYEEEILNAAEALWFSPGGSYLAVATFNDTDVESAIYPYYGDPGDKNNQYPEIVEFKYPKAGRTNPTVNLRVYKLDGASPIRNIPAPVDIVGLDHILGRVSWANDDFLTVLWLNRRQSTSILVNCNLKDYKCSIVQERNEYNGWIDIASAFFDKTGNKIMELQPASSSDERYMHVMSLDFSKMEIVDHTPGNWTVTEIAGWNRDHDSIFFVVAPGDTPWQRQLWKTDGNETRCVSCKEPYCHSVSVNFAPQADYGVVTCSAKLQPPKTFLYRAREDDFTLITDNKRLIDKLQHYRMPVPLFGKIDLSYGGKAHISLLLPPDVTSVTKELSKKFPLIVKVYAGPGTARVKDNFDIEYYSTYLATNRSYVVAAIDVRGTGAMTVDEMYAVNNVLGTVEITDTLEAIKHIVKKYSNLIDGSRVGVWGWSYGGFASTMMLVRDEERLLACGAAVAPVSSWRYYDSIYTERYMDTPANNPSGYDESDLTALAGHLRGRKYMLVHGTGDDNVHYQHSLQLAKKLQHADIDFEQMSYTDENHSLYGVSRHLYHALDRYWTECFK